MKKCTVCECIKPLEEFYNRKASEDGKAYRCKDCDNKAGKKYKAENKERFREKNINRVRKYKYGITSEEVDKLFAEQDGKCAICFNEFSDDNKHRQAIDHCHTTNKVRGLLCVRCNQALGLFRDNKHILYSAIEYLGR